MESSRPNSSDAGSPPPATWQRCWEALTKSEHSIVCWPQAASNRDLGTTPAEVGGAGDRYLFPGSFNPLHRGHSAIADWVERRFGEKLAFELSIANVDKPSLGCLDAYRRVNQFQGQQTVWLTRAARFLEKARLFPASTFVVGADTILRVADVRYYAGGSRQRAAALDELTDLDCKFLVFGRLVDGLFRDASDLDRLPGKLANHCQWVPEEAFRMDISSTQLRRGH